MVQENVSLLYPSGITELGQLDVSFIEAIGAEPLFDVIKFATRYTPNVKHPMQYFTSDLDTISYRLNVVEDLLNNPRLCQIFEELLPDLQDLKELRFINDHSSDTASSLYSISEIELYLSSTNKLFSYFQNSKPHLASEGMNRLRAMVTEIYGSAEHQALMSEVSKMSFNIRNIKSITIGVNLDPQLRPLEAGVVSINEVPFRSGNIIDKILRVDFGRDEYSCLAPLTTAGSATSGELSGFSSTVINVLEKIINSAVKQWKPIIRKFTVSRAHFLIHLVDEIRFLLGGVALIRRLQDTNMPICKPEGKLANERIFTVHGLYNPVVVMNSESKQNAVENVVLNDIEFDQNGMIYLLTGPNQGGKTVFTQSIGIVQMMFQLGLFVPAQSAIISPVDYIFTHFQHPEQDDSQKGRFGHECYKIKKMFETLSGNSLVLMDETFSSTSASEATFVAQQVILGMARVGCRVLFATHLHDLAQNIDTWSTATIGTSGIDTLTAEMDEKVSGKRSFKIKRTRPEGFSHAQDVAEKYGLSLENLTLILKERMIIS